MIIALLTRLARGATLAYRRRKARRELRLLSDHVLRDIGIERHQIAAAVVARVTAAANPLETERQWQQAKRPAESRALHSVPRLRTAA